jgi:hypothetical protein
MTAQLQPAQMVALCSPYSAQQSNALYDFALWLASVPPVFSASGNEQKTPNVFKPSGNRQN